MTVLICFSLPGIGEEERMMVSPSASLRWGCSLLAMRVRAETDSP